MTMFRRALVSPVGYTNIAGTSNTTMTVSVFAVVSRMLSMTSSVYNSFETTVGTRFVLDHTVSPISFFQSISSSNVISMSMFVLRFNIVGMWIMHTIFKFVVGLSLD